VKLTSFQKLEDATFDLAYQMLEDFCPDFVNVRKGCCDHCDNVLADVRANMSVAYYRNAKYLCEMVGKTCDIELSKQFVQISREICLSAVLSFETYKLEQNVKRTTH
jgi:hypothetical protein